jgi:peptidoglycan/xylan/chitin deacetylase (PgdA/CDA1 family)
MHKDYIKISKIYSKIIWKYRRIASKYMYRKMFDINIPCPIISFSFDDAPVTAFTNGSEILNKYGATATYYMSLGRLGLESPSGPIATYKDLLKGIKEGHELGCHTFDHRHSWDTKTEEFVQSVLKNRKQLSSMFPNVEFLSLAYPICDPKPRTKKKVSELFICCRGGEQGFNIGPTDLNLINAFFLDSRIGDPIDKIKMIIDQNIKAKGWLIFCTHDIDDRPTMYGCSKKFLENAVRYSAQSGALLMPVGKACCYVLNCRSPHHSNS